MKFHIREAREQDAKAIHGLICDLESENVPLAPFTKIFKNNRKRKHIGYFVAQADEQVLAFGSVYLSQLLHHGGSVAEIQELIVARGFRHNRIGNTLVQEMVEWSRRRGALQVEVSCNKTRVKAQQFYQGMGFCRTHEKFILSD